MEFKGVKWSQGGCSGRMIKTNQYGGFVADVDTQANANRIIECVNAMDGIKSPQKLRNEHAEMLAMLKMSYERIDMFSNGESGFLRDIEQLIKKATEI